MAQSPIYADISVWQPANIDWGAYRAWAAQWDGIARVAMRSSYGKGYVDQHFAAYREGAINAGVDCIIYYHYSYPQYNSAQAEADWQHQIVGDIRQTDLLMLDYEEQVSQATAVWAYEWLARQEQNYGGKLPTIYASDAYIRARLQMSTLAKYPLTLADWQFSSIEHPPCPPPWKTYAYLQYTDAASGIPGIAGRVDANVYLHIEDILPATLAHAGWTDDGIILTGPNGVPVGGLMRTYVLAHNWDPGDWPLQVAERLAILEEGNRSLGAGLTQAFTKTVLEIPDSTGKVQPMYCGKEIVALRALVTQLQTGKA